MRIISLGPFNPLCENEGVVINRETLPSSEGFSYKPCINQTPPPAPEAQLRANNPTSVTK